MVEPLNYFVEHSRSRFIYWFALTGAWVGGTIVLGVEIISYFWVWIFDHRSGLGWYYQLYPFFFKALERSAQIVSLSLLLAVYAILRGQLRPPGRITAYLAIAFNLLVGTIYILRHFLGMPVE